MPEHDSTGTDSVIASLRRRKLVQWTAGYAAAAWVLLQVVALVGQQFDWSPVLLRAITIVVATGVPVTVVLAWFHGERGAQEATGAELALLFAILALGGAWLWRTVALPPESSDAPTAAGAGTPAGPAAPARAQRTVATDASIAVLPFIDLSEDKQQEYFSEGMSEELLNLLAKIPRLRVIARTSSFSFKGKAMPVTEIAHALDVATLLEGSVRKSGERVRITVQLVRASDGAHLWSENYDRTLDDVFKVQDEIAAAVVERLRVTLLGAVPNAKPVDPRAYPLILQGRALASQVSAEGRVQGIAAFQRALAIAPEEPRAWAGLASAYSNQALFGERPLAEGERLSREAAQKALSFDADNVSALATLSLLSDRFDGDFVAAAQYLQRALELAPANPGVLANSALFLQAIGRLDDSVALAEHQVSLDPANPTAHGNLAVLYYQAGRWDRAIASSRTALALSPGYVGMPCNIATTLLVGRRDAAAALEAVQAESDEVTRLECIAPILHALGRKPESDAAVATLVEKFADGQWFYIATVFAYRDEADAAFEWLDKAVAQRDPGLGTIAVEPLLSSLHDDPRWLPLLRRLGRAPEQLAKIEFKVAVPG